MGQKVNPVGMRIGINRDWNSRWYADDKSFNVCLNEDIKIRNFLQSELKKGKANLSHIEIERTKADNGTRVLVSIFTDAPGAIIGEKGTEVTRLENGCSKLIKNGTLKISVVDVKQPKLDANLVAQNIASQIENRVSFRVAQKKAIKDVMKAGAKGIRTLVSGRLGGAEIARSEGYKEGIIPLHTLRSDIDFAVAQALTTYGIIGVKVWICRGEIRPTKKTQGGEE